MYTCQALWTAARYRLGVTFVILNNSSYRILKQRTHAMKGLSRPRPTATSPWTSTTRGSTSCGLAESLGVRAERIEKASRHRPARSGGPSRARARPSSRSQLDRSFKPA